MSRWWCNVLRSSFRSLARSSPLAEHAGEHALRHRFDRVDHHACRERLRLAVVLLGWLLHREPLQQRARLTVAALDGVVERRRLGDVLERLAHDLVGEHRRVDPLDDDLGTVDRPPEHVELAGVDRTARGVAAPSRRVSRSSAGRRRRRWSGGSAARRVTASRRRSGSIPVTPASSMRYWSRTSSLGCSAMIAIPASAAPARPSTDARSARPSVRSSRNFRNGLAPATAFVSDSGSSRQASAGSRPGREVGHRDLHLVLLLPLVPALGRGLARAVGVVGEHDLAGEVLQDLEVLVGERGPARRHRHGRARRARTPSRRCSPRRSRPRRARRSRPWPS